MKPPPRLSLPSPSPPPSHLCLPLPDPKNNYKIELPILEEDFLQKNEQWRSKDRTRDLTSLGGGGWRMVYRNREGGGEIAISEKGEYYHLPGKEYHPNTFLGWVAKISDENTNPRKKGVMTFNDKIKWWTCLVSIEQEEVQCKYILKLLKLLKITCEGVDGTMPTSQYKMWEDIPYHTQTAIEEARKEDDERIEKGFKDIYQGTV
jgi:hypothetical protein